ncbi:hypothetical protein B0H10DRAFT_482056 [Mycena sp. CBHHK59/15]|nr:hypothetical protein B0H10DRAFT_482056 [Mycena sp. CBHHK59/15]
MPNTTPVPPSSTSSYRAASQAPSERTVCATPQSAFPHFSVPQPALPKNMSRSQIHSGIIRNSVRVTRIRLESMKLQRELARWKTTQLSPQFHRVSPIAGNRLNSIAHDLTNQLKAVNLRLKQAENELLQFPNLPSSVPNLMNSRKVEKEMMAYTVELTAWFQSFTTFATLETRDNSSLGIKRRLEELEDILEEVEQKFHPAETFSRQRNAEYIERAIETLPTGELNGRSLATEKGVADQSPNTWDGAAEKLSGKFGSLAEQVVTLIQANADGKRQIDLLTAQREQHHHMKVQMESQFERLEKAQQDRRKLLDLMTAELTQLASAPQPQATAQVDEAVLTHVKSIVETIIETQVVPALEALNKQYTGIVEQRMKELHRTIQPALDATEEICQRAEALAT